MARDSPEFDIKQLFTLCYCYTKNIAAVLQYESLFCIARDWPIFGKCPLGTSDPDPLLRESEGCDY